MRDKEHLNMGKLLLADRFFVKLQKDETFF